MIARHALIVVGVAFATQSAPLKAAPYDTAPHRAIYSFELKSARADSGIVDVKGGMTYEVVDACDGWTVNQKIVMRLLNRQGREIRSVTTYSSWESKNGRRFRFNTRTMRNGRLSEHYSGSATLEANGAGMAIFKRPKPKRMKLPKGSVFPTTHSEMVMKAAMAGTPFVWKVLFDGSTDEGPYGVSAVIGKPRLAKSPAEAEAQNVLGKLGAGKFWTISLGFYPNASRKPDPEYELRVGLHANSVTRWLVMDYGSFVINSRLTKAQALPKAQC